MMIASVHPSCGYNYCASIMNLRILLQYELLQCLLHVKSLIAIVRHDVISIMQGYTIMQDYAIM